jgi:hypothetical protein
MYMIQTVISCKQIVVIKWYNYDNIGRAASIIKCFSVDGFWNPFHFLTFHYCYYPLSWGNNDFHIYRQYMKQYKRRYWKQHLCWFRQSEIQNCSYYNFCCCCYTKLMWAQVNTVLCLYGMLVCCNHNNKTECWMLNLVLSAWIVPVFTGTKVVQIKPNHIFGHVPSWKRMSWPWWCGSSGRPGSSLECLLNTHGTFIQNNLQMMHLNNHHINKS